MTSASITRFVAAVFVMAGPAASAVLAQHHAVPDRFTETRHSSEPGGDTDHTESPADVRAGDPYSAAIDRVLTWRSYERGSHRSARVRLFPSTDLKRPITVIVDEQAESAGRPVTDEARYVAEVVGREFGFDPIEATFVFRFSEASFVENAEAGEKTLLLRARFGRSDSTGRLTGPSWRVIPPEALGELTDRAL